mmetsp:Transcript_10499/g.21169  ORF Transcript_10499/g.21169 Transcript_10499/m.21169 type:complete len:184 (-) Transcript_10499:250-801(-)
MKIVAFSLIAGAAAFNPQIVSRQSTALFNGLGAGGMADTRDPDAFEHEDPRKSISAAPSFEEYLKQRGGGGGAAPAPAPAAAAPAPAPATSWAPPAAAAPASSEPINWGAAAPAASAPAPAPATSWAPPAAAPAPAPAAPAGPPGIGAGGMADTRDPEAFVHEDPRKSISAAPSFEEYLKQRS